MDIIKMSNKHIDECVDLFIDVFTKAPWHDTYSSRKQVVSFFQNYMTNNYFVGYVLKEESSIIALSISLKQSDSRSRRKKGAKTQPQGLREKTIWKRVST